jgi:precorrin-6B methylase 2
VTRVVTRIVLAIDAADRTVHVVREAVELASRFDAELEGLFVEDDALLRLAGHEFARRYDRFGAGREFGPREIEHEWRVIAGEVRRALEQEAQKRSVRSRFEVMRGGAEAALRERLARGELVFVAWGGWPTTARQAPVRVFYDGGASSRRALEIAVRMAGPQGQILVWLVPEDHRATELALDVRREIGDRVGHVRLAGLSDASPGTIRRAIAEEPGGVLLVPGAHELAVRIAQRSMSARFPCSVVLVH